MRSRILAAATGLLLAALPAWTGQNQIASVGSWSGVIINGACSVDEAAADARKCAAMEPDSELALYDDTVRKVYTLNERDRAKSFFGQEVTVEGALEDGTIRITSIKPFASIGLDIGEKAPAFSAPDQFGYEQNLESLKGPNGTVLLFYRSADWCPYCKGQLIQLQAAKARFEKRGIKLAGISYDSVDILKFFSARRGIEFPLLADPDSKIIRMYQVLNSEGTGQNKGMARPGYFFIDPAGIIREKFFEERFNERLTGNNVLAKMFPELGEEVTDTVEAPHLQLNLEQSDRVGMPGNVVTLTAELKLPPDVHVYAPGTEGYKPIKLVIDPLPEFQLRTAIFPHAKNLYLPAIKETVPVFEGAFRIRQDVKVNSNAEFTNSLGADGKFVTIKGNLEYQACDNKICFLPASVPVEWQMQILPLDRQRAPDDIRHK